MASIPEQTELELFPAEPQQKQAQRVTPAALEELLNEGLPLPLRLKITRNQVSMVSIQFKADHILCRLHEAFLHAPPAIHQHLHRYLKGRRKRHWAPVADYAQTIEPQQHNTPTTKTTGQHYDLKGLLDEVNQTWFDGTIEVNITWGRNPSRGPSRKHTSIHFGSYAANANLIRIHPRLDSPQVPIEFVKFVIYHEILHIVHPPYRKNGRWVFHPKVFRTAEKRYPDFETMQVIAAKILEDIRIAGSA